MGETALVSVLITSYNREKFIREALESVLAQTYTNLEVIISDNCSTDNTVSIVNEYLHDKRVRVFVNDTNIGQFPNRNKAASYATGKYIKYVDSDDSIYPDAIAKMVAAMETYPDAGMVLNDVRLEIKDIRYYSSHESYIQHYFKLSSLLHAGPLAMMVRRDIMEKIGGFTEKLHIVDDNVFTLRVAAISPVIGLPGKLVDWREHDGQEIATIGKNRNDYVKQRYFLHQLILNHPDCPLNKKEKKAAIRNMKNIFGRQLITEAFKNRSLKNSLQLRKDVSFSFADLALSIFPNKKL